MTAADGSVKALVIPADGEQPVREIDLPRAGLRVMQDVVGGYVEAVPIPVVRARASQGRIPEQDADRSTGYVNDQGKMVGLPFNGRATDFMIPGVGLFFGDYIAGDFLLAGFDPDTGDHAELPASIIARARLIESEAA